MRFLITAGPTREPIDPVRYISNRSSGKMGYAIAQAALEAGCETILVTGPVALEPPGGAEIRRVTTSDEMLAAVQSRIGEADVFIMCAAVADFKPARRAPRKMKKSAALRRIEITPTVDILATAARPIGKKILIAGFAAETENLERNAKKKLREKKCDILIGNDVSRTDAGLESDYNAVNVYFKTGGVKKFPRELKTKLAKRLVKIFIETKKSIDATSAVYYDKARSNVDHKNFQPSATADRKGGLRMAMKKKAPKKLAAKKKPAKKVAKKVVKKKKK